MILKSCFVIARHFGWKSSRTRILIPVFMAICFGTPIVAENLCKSGDLVEFQMGDDTYKYFVGFDGLALKLGAGCTNGTTCEIEIRRKYKGKFQRFMDLTINGDLCEAFEKYERTKKNPSFGHLQSFPLSSFPVRTLTEYTITSSRQRLNFVISRYHHGRRLPEPSMYEGTNSAGLVHAIDVTMGELYISSE